MDAISALPLTENVPKPTMLNLAADGRSLAEDEEVQAAKDFESVFINKLIDAMNETVGDWGLEKDATSKQIQGIFNMFLSQDISRQGGFGLWRQLHESLHQAAQSQQQGASVG